MIQEKDQRTALFHNFTDKDFTGYYNGKPRTFKAGEQKYMPEYLAKHFAKHLTNQVLMEKGGKFENYTSPKFPEQVPAFWEIFQKACIIEEDAQPLDKAEMATELANRENGPVRTVVDNKPPQIIGSPDDDEDFEGLAENKKA